MIEEDPIDRLIVRATLAALGRNQTGLRGSRRGSTELARGLCEQQPYSLALVEGLLLGWTGLRLRAESVSSHGICGSSCCIRHEAR